MGIGRVTVAILRGEGGFRHWRSRASKVEHLIVRNGLAQILMVASDCQNQDVAVLGVSWWPSLIPQL